MSDRTTSDKAVSAKADLAAFEGRLERLRQALPPSNAPLRIAARQLRWFRAAFHAHVAVIEAETGARFAVHDTALASVFVDWLRAIAAQRPSDRAKRDAFFDFAAGLALREFCRHAPLSLTLAPPQLDAATPEGFWPEGYVATSFCLALASAARRQEFGDLRPLDPLAVDLRSWWSLRENARRDPGFAAGFLQAISGQDPNWRLPDIFRASPPVGVVS